MILQPLYIHAKYKVLVVVCVVSLVCSAVMAQETKDTSNIYRTIERKAKEHKATKFIYEAIFENTDEVEDTIPVSSRPKKAPNPFVKYRGKIVRKIRIFSLDPFGSSVNNLHEAYAVGLLIRNEHLVVNTFEISIGLYPYMPGYGNFTTKLNPISSYNVMARDFVVAKPELVSYQ